MSSFSQPFGGDGYKWMTSIASLRCHYHCSINANLIMSSFILPIHDSLGLLVFLSPSNLAFSAFRGIQTNAILSTCPNHRSFRWTTLSNRVLLLPNACLMSWFPLFSSLWTPQIQRSQLISDLGILFSSCFRIFQHSEQKGVVLCSYTFICRPYKLLSVKSNAKIKPQLIQIASDNV